MIDSTDPEIMEFYADWAGKASDTDCFVLTRIVELAQQPANFGRLAQIPRSVLASPTARVLNYLDRQHGAKAQKQIDEFLSPFEADLTALGPNWPAARHFVRFWALADGVINRKRSQARIEARLARFAPK